MTLISYFPLPNMPFQTHDNILFKPYNELEDETEGAQTLACAAGGCEI